MSNTTVVAKPTSNIYYGGVILGILIIIGSLVLAYHNITNDNEPSTPQATVEAPVSSSELSLIDSELDSLNTDEDFSDFEEADLIVDSDTVEEAVTDIDLLLESLDEDASFENPSDSDLGF